MTPLQIYPFEDSVWSYSGHIARQRKLYRLCTGGHSATALSWIDEFDLDAPGYRKLYEPVPYSIMRQYRIVDAEHPALPNRATWTDTTGRYAGQTIHGVLCGPAGTTYTHDYLTEGRFWDVPATITDPATGLPYTFTPNTFHGYHGTQYCPITDRGYRWGGNNEMNEGLGGPIGRLTIGGSPGFWDFATSKWVELTDLDGLGNTLCRDPNTGNFIAITSTGWFKAIDPRTNRHAIPAVDLKAQRHWTTPYKTFAKIDSAMVWLAHLNCALYISRHSPKRAFLVRLGAGMAPMLTEIPIRTVAGVPFPDDSNSDFRMFCQRDTDHKIVGGLKFGMMWLGAASESELLFDRTDVTHLETRKRRVKDAAGNNVVPAAYEDYQARLGPSHFGSCQANVCVDGVVYFVANQLFDPAGGSGPMALYALGTTALPPPPPPPPPTVEATVTPESVPYSGGAVTIDAAVANADEVKVNGQAATLPMVVQVTQPTTFVLQAIGPSGAAEDSVSVAVETAEAALVRLEAEKAQIAAELEAEHADDAVMLADLEAATETITLRDETIAEQRALIAELEQYRPDVTPPETTIEVQRADEYVDAVELRFAAIDNKPGSVLELSLDGAPFVQATSPHTWPVSVGTHAASVRSRDAAGNVDETPATIEFERKQRPADPPPDEEEPPPPQPPVQIQGALQVPDGECGMTGYYFDWANEVTWTHKGTGDHIDANGVEQGPAPWHEVVTPRLPISGQTADVEVDATRLAKEWQATGNVGAIMRGVGEVRIASRVFVDETKRPTLVVQTASGEVILPWTSFQSESGSVNPSTIAVDGKRVAKQEYVVSRTSFATMQVGNLPSEPIISAKLRFTVVGYGGRVQFFKMKQPTLWNPFNYRPTLGLAANYPLDKGILNDPAVLMARDFTLWKDLPPEEAAWQRQLFHPQGRDRDEKILVGEGPYGTNVLRGTVATGRGNADIQMTHEQTRTYCGKSDLQPWPAEWPKFVPRVVHTRNPYNGRKTAHEHPTNTRTDPSHPDCWEEAWFRYHVEYEKSYMECFR
jgi:hypothetical protein